MRSGCFFGVGSVLAWFLFPMVPALLGSTCLQELNWTIGRNGGPDPRDWDWQTWIVLTGPLLGYGFLAGATLDLPDDPNRRGIRGWLSKRSLWVAIGPWLGFLVFAVVDQAGQLVSGNVPRLREWRLYSFQLSMQGNWVAWLLILAPLLAWTAYGWAFVAWAAVRRARRLDRLRQSLVRGLAVAIGFVGSLFGTFWTITEAWRGYFFDPRIMPTLIAVAALALMGGCAAPETYGEVRRRELFQSMLMAWLLGLAFAWRWWSRSRSKPPGPSS
jgi:hypothetical protein